jgi:DNA repair photolyase
MIMRLGYSDVCAAVYSSSIMHAQPETFRKGRGALSNKTNRYESYTQEVFDDGWGSLDQPVPPISTRLYKDSSRSVISYNRSPDIGFDRSINPYRGCEHGCIYCFARPTHAWLGLSPGLDFESQLYYKSDAAELLKKELAKPRYQCQPLALGAVTDPYQPIERELKLTREILQILSDCEHPVQIVTKSSLVVRDIDILAPMAARQLAGVCISITTLDRHLARVMEPRAHTPEKRLNAVAQLSKAGIPVTVLTAPIIPMLNDCEIEALLQKAHETGACSAGYVLLRLPLEIKDLFQEWLHEHFPDRAEHILQRIRDMRGGKLNDPNFGSRMRGQGEYADLIRQRFKLAYRKLKFPGHPDLNCNHFSPVSYGPVQLSLF